MKSTSVFIGSHRDPHLSLVRDRLAEFGHTALILDPTEPREIAFSPQRAGHVEIENEEFHVNLVWWRWKDSLFDRANAEANKEPQDQHDLDEWREGLKYLWAANRAACVNPFVTSIEFSNKLNQIELAGSLGFATPKTHLSNSKTKLQHIVSDQRLVIKPLTQSRYQDENGDLHPYDTAELLTAHIDGLSPAEHRSNIAFVQDYIEKRAEWRINVLYGDIYARRFEPTAMYNFDPAEQADWRPLYRYTGQSGERGAAVEVPDALADLVNAYASHTQLNILCFDIAECANGEFVFLEANPDGQWLWLTKQGAHVDSVTRGIMRTVKEEAA